MPIHPVNSGPLAVAPTGDWLRKPDALFLADKIERHWHALGALNVKVRAEPMGLRSIGTKVRGLDEAWQVRSNLVNGLPPVEGQEARGAA